ncbi:DUF3040 domain-containing protein [Corynebacterium lizhenjunii]|uniref:DUF3040 domain-containing protein n=1 Tax=Corynebacterium lizhenjunii TaxID=2709394 RepID=A0A7T0PBG6_9CORY|nr:DUF3040 domain-containing protein [Corynebacterium lizhenjunii]QPK78512.1 DUF3040 domain-containing protein [Corynebacterium lizhenjunii]
MSLSEQEMRALREIEQSLLAEDPQFGSAVAQGHGSGTGPGAAQVNLRGVALVVVGILLLLGGVALAQQSLWFVTLSIAGFLLMFGAGVWMLRGGGAVSATGSAPKRQRAPRSESKANSNLEDSFRRRFEGN